VIRVAPDDIGQFRAAIEAAGLAPPAAIVADGKLHRFATSARPGDDAGWYVLHADRIPAGAFGDWRSGLSLTWQARKLRREMRPLRKPPTRMRPAVEDRIEAALALWRVASPARGTLAETYLAARGIRVPIPESLRFHGGLSHPSGGTWPAMVALVTSGGDGAPMAVHRTFLARHGSGKAPVLPVRMMLGPCGGGAVRLAPPADITMIGEGIETCLAAMLATGYPAWAALSTSGLRALDLPKCVREVIVLADGDDAGEAAARDCAWRWRREGRRVRIARPPRGMDFNDVLMGHAARIEEGAQ
jgi:putative DNA primase/helicase